MVIAEKTAEEFYTPPPKLGNWESFKLFIWNPNTRQILGRTGLSWAKIVLFYIIFYAALVGFFALMLYVFFQTLDYKIPKYKLDSSIIGSNPGLGFRPMPPESNVESTLIWYKGTQPENFRYWKEELDNFLTDYRTRGQTAGSGQNIADCSFDNPPEEGKVCNVNIRDFGENCISDNDYGFKLRTPCIFLKLNKIFDWKPVNYKDPKDLPDSMPDDLVEHIKSLKNSSKIAEMDVTWVSCEGESPADIENIGPIQYFPQRGFPSYFFPFMNAEGYLSPLVAVHFERPQVGVLINIECKAWAHNIKHDRMERRGSVHFELMID